MRKTLGITLIAGTLMFGGAGVANATASSAPVPSSTTTTQADDMNNPGNHQDSDKTGLWGLAGLLGLVGLAGLKRRNNTELVGSGARSANSPRV
jgi:MYXO-CTERM domain-containing protein